MSPLSFIHVPWVFWWICISTVTFRPNLHIVDNNFPKREETQFNLSILFAIIENSPDIYISHGEMFLLSPNFLPTAVAFYVGLLNNMITKHSSVLSQDNSFEHTSSFRSKPLTKRCFHPQKSINTVYSCQRHVKRWMKFKDERV